MVKKEKMFGETGTTVLPDEISSRNGAFEACQKRTDICGYACCQFGKLGNWIYALPGEIEEARQQGLSFGHLEVEEMPDGGAQVKCLRPCVAGEFKSIDCAVYGLFPANVERTRFIVADSRKCPIPSRELIDHARWAQRVLLDWDKLHPGTMEGAIAAGKKFKAYQPFPFEVPVDGSEVRGLTEEECNEIAPEETLPSSYTPKYENIPVEVMPLYTGMGTPEEDVVKQERQFVYRSPEHFPHC